MATTLRDLLLRTYENLQILEERKAKQGGSVEIKLLNEIEDHRTAIDLIEAALGHPQSERSIAELKQALRPLLVASNVEHISLDALEPEKPPLPYEPEMVLIPAGPFTMGSQPGPNIPADELPPHEVTLPAYAIGRYPITNGQYAEFIRQNPEQAVPKRAGWFLREPPGDKVTHPVVGVDWYDALAYCAWLSEQSGRAYRLPTEAEWEKAASWAEGVKRRYPWGEAWQPARCNSGSRATTPVTAYPDGASAYGCYDMAGNVQEWVNTLWGADLLESDYPYPYRADDGRENPQADRHLYRVYRLHRGGAFRDLPPNLRCAARGASDPDSKLRWRGFRVARDP